MFFLAPLRAHPEFLVGARQFLPAAPGVAAWGLVTGVAMLKSGLSNVEASFMALSVFAGSSQLAATPLILAGAPIWVILATAFCVNLRFVVFSAHLRSYLMHHPRWLRMAGGYFIADLSYVMFVQRFASPATTAEGRLAQDAFMAGNCMVNWLSWVASSVCSASCWGTRCRYPGVLVLPASWR